MGVLQKNNEGTFSQKSIASLIIVDSFLLLYKIQNFKPLHHLPTSARHSLKRHFPGLELKDEKHKQKNIKKLWENRRNVLQERSEIIIMNS